MAAVILTARVLPVVGLLVAALLFPGGWETWGAPLIIGHRGAPGYLPEHTLAGYTLAIRQGADFVEPDLVISKDGVLFARHENEISGTTDVAEKFPGRRTTKTVDGRSIPGWFLEDFTAAEIKTLRARERLPFRNQTHNGRYAIPTLREILALVAGKSVETGRAIGVYPETKHPTYFRALGLPLGPPLVALLKEFGLNRPTAKVFIQSFEVANLKALKKIIRVPLVQLIGRPTRSPPDFAAQGNPRTYGDLLSPAGLAEIAGYAGGIGPHKSLAFASSGALIKRAHEAGLVVHAFTFRNEPRFLKGKFKDDPLAEYQAFFKLGVDGVFSDFPDTAVKARAAYQTEK